MKRALRSAEHARNQLARAVESRDDRGRIPSASLAVFVAVPAASSLHPGGQAQNRISGAFPSTAPARPPRRDCEICEGIEEESGEPRWNRTLSAAVSNLLTACDFWSQFFCCQPLPVLLLSTAVFVNTLESTPVLETCWRRHKVTREAPTTGRGVRYPRRATNVSLPRWRFRQK